MRVRFDRRKIQRIMYIQKTILGSPKLTDNISRKNDETVEYIDDIRVVPQGNEQEQFDVFIKLEKTVYRATKI